MDAPRPFDAQEVSSNAAASGTNRSLGSPEHLPPIVSPPYWQHVRHASRNSVLSIGKQPIRLEDNTEEPVGTRSPLWAKLVSIDSHTVVTGNLKGVGDYVVWICRVQTLDVSIKYFGSALPLMPYRAAA